MAVLPLLSAGVVAQEHDAPLSVVQRALMAMGTELRVEAQHTERRQALAASEAARAAVARVERRLSTWIEDSELSQLNHARVDEAIAISEELAHDLHAITRWFEATEGAFEPGIGAPMAFSAGTPPEASAGKNFCTL